MAEAFPIATAFGKLAKRAGSGTQLNVDTQLLRLGSEEKTTLTSEVNIPCACDMNTGRKGSGALDVTDTLRSIFMMLVLSIVSCETWLEFTNLEDRGKDIQWTSRGTCCRHSWLLPILHQ